MLRVLTETWGMCDVEVGQDILQKHRKTLEDWTNSSCKKLDSAQYKAAQKSRARNLGNEEGLASTSCSVEEFAPLALYAV